MTDRTVWINGSLGGRLDPFDRGFLLGDGVFDTAVAIGRVPFAGDRHIARLVGHAAAIGIALDGASVRAGWSALLEAAGLECAILRTTVTRGSSGRGVRPDADPAPTIHVSAAPWDADLIGRPVQLVTAAARRNETSPLSRLKAVGYLDNILAMREAVAAGADDALFLNGAGRVACTTIANLFVLAGSRLATPPQEEGILAGIMRGLVMETATPLGLEVEERSLGVDDLREADEVLLTNSVRFVFPVRSLDGVPVGSRRADLAAALIDALLARVREACGHDPRLRAAPERTGDAVGPDQSSPATMSRARANASRKS